MKKRHFKIDNIPVILWGEESDKIYIAVHGNMSHKEDTVIQFLADEVTKKGYQVISFDLPEHGERKGDDIPCKVQICVNELKTITNYVKKSWKELSLFSCSMGAYFSLVAYKNENLHKVLFLSPVVNMERIIENMMMWFQITPEKLKQEKTIDTPIGQKLYWDYFCYVKEHLIHNWEAETYILYGSKDDLCEYEYIKKFSDDFHCDLKILEDGDHYFHTKEQLKEFKQWLQTHTE